MGGDDMTCNYDNAVTYSHSHMYVCYSCMCYVLIACVYSHDVTMVMMGGGEEPPLARGGRRQGARPAAPCTARCHAMLPYSHHSRCVFDTATAHGVGVCVYLEPVGSLHALLEEEGEVVGHRVHVLATRGGDQQPFVTVRYPQVE